MTSSGIRGRDLVTRVRRTEAVGYVTRWLDSDGYDTRMLGSMGSEARQSRLVVMG